LKLVNPAYTIWGAMISIIPSFYPAVAESKGANPAQVEYTVLLHTLFKELFILDFSIRCNFCHIYRIDLTILQTHITRLTKRDTYNHTFCTKYFFY
jgi:hypothetical protein